jgi:hypothetical protein
MRRPLLLGSILAVACVTQASAFGTIACQWQDGRIVDCTHSQDERSESDAYQAALDRCNRLKGPDLSCRAGETVKDTCVAVFRPRASANYLFIIKDPDQSTANDRARVACTQSSISCVQLVTFCDKTPGPIVSSAPISSSTSGAGNLSVRESQPAPDDSFSGIDAVFTAIAEANVVMWFAAFVLNLIFSVGLFRIVQKHSRRLYVLGMLTDLLPDLPSFIRRVCSSFAPGWGVLRTQLV